jgi:hypothetical protein
MKQYQQYPQYQQYQTYPQSPLRTALPTGGIVAMGLAGAVITAIGATARGLRETKAGEITRSEMIVDVAKEALGGGLATAAGAAVAGTVTRSGALSLAAMAAVGIGVKYVYDGMVGSVCQTAPAETAPVKAVKKA